MRNRKQMANLVHKLDEALCALAEVRAELVHEFGDDFGLGVGIGPGAPHNVRRRLRALADQASVDLISRN